MIQAWFPLTCRWYTATAWSMNTVAPFGLLYSFFSGLFYQQGGFFFT